VRSIATRVAVDMYPAARGARAMALCVERRTDDGERRTTKRSRWNRTRTAEASLGIGKPSRFRLRCFPGERELSAM